MLNFLTDWRYWVCLLTGCVALSLARHGVPFWDGFVNGFAIGVAYFVRPRGCR